MTLEGLPPGAFLAWRYADARRDLDHGQVYWDDGRVEAVGGEGPGLLCRLSTEQVAEARRAVEETGLDRAGDRAAHEAQDTAAVTYWWRLDGRAGSMTNGAYPVERPPEIEALEARLADLEEAAGGWPLRAAEDESATGLPGSLPANRWPR